MVRQVIDKMCFLLQDQRRGEDKRTSPRPRLLVQISNSVALHVGELVQLGDGQA